MGYVRGVLFVFGGVWLKGKGDIKYLFGSMFNVHYIAVLMNKISVEDYASKYNPVRNRRGHKMSASYIYRLIRQDIKEAATRPLWFKYELTGDKDRILIIIK